MAEPIPLNPSDLKAMPKAKKLALYRALTKAKLRQEQRKSLFYLESSHEGQRAFHKAKNRIRILLGGNRSGKTTAGVLEMLWLVTGTHPFRPAKTPIKAMIVAQDFTTHVKDIIQTKISEWFPEGLIERIETNHARAWSKIYLKNGSTIDIKTHDQDLKVFEGSDYDVVWFDEPPPELIFKAVWRGLTDRQGICYITGTPIVEPWMLDVIEDAERDETKLVWYHYVNTYENAKNIGNGDEAEGRRRIREFEKMLDADERTARIEGKFLQLKGRIFKGWDRAIHLIEPFAWPNEWPIIYSVDPHGHKPWAVSFVGITENRNKILIASELIPGVISDVAKRTIEMRDELNLQNMNSKPRISYGLIDNAASAELMEKKHEEKKVKIIDEFNREVQPFLPPVKCAPKDVTQKISLFKEWLKPRATGYGHIPQFMAMETPQNKRFRYEVEHYRWATYTGKQNKNELKDVPVKKDDDILDTVLQIALVLGAERADAEFDKREPLKYTGRRR